MFYRNNVFVFETYEGPLRTLRRFAKRMPKRYLKLIQQFHLRWACEHYTVEPSVDIYGWSAFGDFVQELEYVGNQSAEPNLRIRQKAGKFVFGSGKMAGCYQVRFPTQMASTADESDWVRVADVWVLGAYAESVPYWILEDDSTISLKTTSRS